MAKLQSFIRSSLFLLLSTTVLVLAVTNDTSNGPINWVEVFKDDFSTNSLDLKKWVPTDRSSMVNNELEYYTPQAVTVKDGVLIIQSSAKQLGVQNYTSGRVNSHDSYTFLYGEFVWRAKIPSGRGLWPALWLSDPRCAPVVPCDYWPPAMVFDFRGDDVRKVTATLWYRSATAGPQPAANSIVTAVDLSADFHLYKITWTKNSLVFDIDSNVVLRVNDDRVPQTKMELVMNTAVGGDFPGPPDASTTFPAYFLIDYVTVRQEQGLVGFNGTPEKTVPAYVAPLAGTLGGIILLAVLLGIAFIQYRKRRLYRGNMRRESDTGSMDSNSTLSSMLYVRTGNAAFDVLMKRYVSLIEIPAQNLQLSDKVLGKGEFGIVYKGVAHGLRGHPKPTTVAVKMLIQSNLDEDQQKQLAEEIKVMTKLGRHLNVVNLMGIVIRGNPLLILEYCPYGSLLTYLKMHRGAYFYDHVDHDGNLLPFDEIEEMTIQADAKQISGRRASFPEENFDGLVMSTRDLLSFSFQISRGMEYLASRSIIHRDLAARNVLVAEKKVVKISDFGMARQRQCVYVLESDQTSLPVKWMPPEAIVSKTFSQKSDIWSFGILLWEIFSLGEMPYLGSKGGSSSLNEFVAWLVEGHQLERPPAAPIQIDDLLRQCWRLRTEERPTFTELREELDKLISDDVTDSYLALDEPYQKFNKLNEELLNTMIIVEEDCNKAKRPDTETVCDGSNYMETFLGP